MKTYLFLILVLFLTPLHAATYYVSQQTGNDAWDGLSPYVLEDNQGPFATLQTGINAANAGDSILVMNGVYVENLLITTSGTILAPITITTYANDTPSVTAASWDGSYALTLQNVSYINIQGLDFLNCAESRRPVLLDNADYCTLNDCNFDNNGGSSAIHINNGSAHNEISYCEFYNTGNDARIWDAHILMQSAGDYNRILHNLFSQTGNHTERGIWCSRTSLTDITDNTFSNLSGIALSVGIEPDEFTTGDLPAQGNSIFNNTFNQNNGIACLLSHCANTEVFNCNFNNNRGETALTLRGSGSKNNRIERNTFTENFSESESHTMHIAVRNAGNDNIIIDNALTGNPEDSNFIINAGFSAIHIQNTSNITVQDNHIEDISYPATIDKSDYNASWIKIPEQGGRAGHGIYLEGPDVVIKNAQILGNTIINCGASGISMSNLENSVIQDNSVTDCGAWGISVLGSHNTVQDNEVSGNGWMHGGCSGINIHGASYGNVVRRNLSIFNKQGTPGQVGSDWWSDGNGIIADQGADSTQIYNNICYGNNGAGIAITGSRYCSVLYNTLIGNGYCEHAGHKAGLAVVTTLAGSREVRAETIIGNIFYNNAHYQMSIADVADHSHVMHHNFYGAGPLSVIDSLIHYRDESLPTWQRDFVSINDFQNYWQNQNNTTNGSGSLDGNPLLICGQVMPNSANDVFPLAPSPIRMAGVSLNEYFENDYLGLTRENTLWDLGAFYVENLAPTVFDLLTPTNHAQIDTLLPVLQWGGSTDTDPGDSVAYHLVLRNVSAMGQTVIDTTMGDTLYNLHRELIPGHTYRWSVSATDYDGHVTDCRREFDFTVSKSTKVEERDTTLPLTLQLYANYPNPFNGSTTISFDVPRPGEIHLEVYNINGRRVKTLYRGQVSAGTHQQLWHGTDDTDTSVSSGIYWVRLRYGNENKIQRMVYIK